MNFKLILDIALNLIRARLKQSIVAAVGVTFGIATFIALISFMNGLNKMLDGLMINRTPHIRLYNEVKPLDAQPIEQSEQYKQNENFISSIKPKDRGKEIYNNKAIISFLKKDDRIIDVAPKVTAQVFFNTGKIEIAGAINGIDVAAEEKLFKVSDYIIEGSVHDLVQNNSIILGKGLAEKMLVTIGETVKVTTSKGALTTLRVVGISQFGIADIDNTYSYTSLTTAQKLLGEGPSYITDIQVKMKDILLAPSVAKEYHDKFDIDAIDIKTANAQFETGRNVRTIISFAVGITLLIVAGFGIYNILNMMIYEKMDSIAILKATGFSGNDVKWIFLSLSIIIGIAGGIFGLLFGYLLSSVVATIPFKTASLPTIKTFPVYYDSRYYFIGIIFSIFTTTIAGLFPALKAGKVDPVVIIRGK
jgi:lipoprotein-releasing system permease protein